MSNDAELNYSDAQNSKESMRNISPANNFSGSGNQPLVEMYTFAANPLTMQR